MRTIKYIIMTFLIILAVIILVVAIWLGLAYKNAAAPPKNFIVQNDLKVTLYKDSTEEYLSCGKNTLRKNSYGLWELYVCGNAEQRGTAMGKLLKNLLYYQESAFVSEIEKFIPSKKYLSFLRIPVFILNRNAIDNIPEEYLKEIYGISFSCSKDFNWIAPSYLRQVNYHAAHDLGHLLQKYHLVGCTAFGVWGNNTADGKMLFGRNFDFYVGNAFARNKIIAFYAPDDGYKFASVTWAGMVGVLSGMNEKGLCITLNAAGGKISLKTATPVSIMAREILQYASNIEEAVEIAHKRKIFVSENFTVSSAIDGRTVVIEKTPKDIAVYEGSGSATLVTNHFQRLQNKDASSDSKYRYEVLEQLLNDSSSNGGAKLDVADIAAILRNQRGKNGKNIGLCNEYAINQSICHHSVIFKPQELLMWISTEPYQSGEYICYDLKRIFDNPDFSHPLNIVESTIPADEDFILVNYPNIVKYRMASAVIQKAIREKQAVSEDILETLLFFNPYYYGTHELLAKYWIAQNDPVKAKIFSDLANKKLAAQ